MARIRFLLFSAISFLLVPFALQAQQFKVANHILLSAQRVSLYQYTYTYQISATNTGPDVPGATCVVTSKSSQTIVVSGNLNFGAMPSGSTAASTNTLVITQDRRYPLSWANLQWDWSLIDATSVKIIGIEGGSISVQNHLGDTLALEIPALALAEGTSISVSVRQTALPSSIANIVYPGVILEPEGLRFSLPVKLRVTFHNAATNPSTAMVFWRKDSNHVLPIANQTVIQNGIQGDIYHYSDYFVGTPTVAEIQAAINEIIVNGGDTSALSILETIDDYFSLMSFAKMLRVLGQDQLAENAENSARYMLEEKALNVISSPSPANPCGQYSVAINQLKSLIISALNDNSLANQVGAKACTLSVLPESLSLYQGESGPMLTATLLDPNGSPRSCAVLNWYSANLSVVGIGPLHNPTVGVTGVGPGVANVSANCEGLLAASLVTVAAGYIGSFTALGQTSSSGCVWNVSWSQTLAVFPTGPAPSFYDMGTLKESGACSSASGSVNYMDMDLTVSGSTISATIGHADQPGGIITIYGKINQAAGTITGTWQWYEYPQSTGGAQADFILYATSAPAN